ncbi:MAG: tetratricopeptide repeat protein [Pseudomonadota bacterium]
MSCGGSFHGLSLWELRSAHKDLPDDPAALKVEADERFSDAGPVDAVNASLRAGCKAVQAERKDGEANYLTCRACFWLMEYGETPVCYDPEDDALQAVECSKHCRQAVRRDRDNPKYAYLLGASMGLELKNAFISTQILNISSLLRTLERAMDLDPGVDGGGPLRLLGTVYLRAPPWPRGPGDGEKALELLERAVEEYPEHPLNHFFYAEALLDDEEYEDALEEIEEARARIDPATQHWRADRYLDMVNHLEARIRAANP